jgi:hypothetical protein
VGGRGFTQPLKVVLDPRSTATPADLTKQFDLSMKISDELKRAVEATQQIGTLRRRLADAKTKASSNSTLLASIASVDSDAAKIAGSGLNAVRLQLNAVLNVVDSADRTPPAQAYALFEQASRDLVTQLAAWNSLQAGKLTELNRSLPSQ